MAFTGDGTALIGDDGYSKTATFGAEVLGDGVTALPVGTYLVIQVAGSSGFPTNTDGTAIAVGDIITVDTGITITPETDDDVVTLTLTNDCDITSWAAEFSKEEVEVTTLCDAIKKYRAGKADMSGTMEGIFKVGTTDATTGRMREFIDIVKQDGSTSYDRYEQQESIRLGFFYANDDENLADRILVIAPYQLYGNAVGGSIGEAQTFSSPFRFSTLTYTSAADDVITINPTLYRLGDGS